LGSGSQQQHDSDTLLSSGHQAKGKTLFYGRGWVNPGVELNQEKKGKKSGKKKSFVVTAIPKGKFY